MRIGKQLIIALTGLGLLLASGGGAAAAGSYTSWTDRGLNYTAPTGSAYYPSVIYNAGGFGGSQPKYAMWYSDGNGASFRVTSADGVAWSAPAAMVGIAGAHHVQVLYDPNCFGAATCTAATPKYKIWFWDASAATIYSISSMATAVSADGVTWTGRAPVAQNAAAKLVQDPDSGTGWNRGTYGPVTVFYQPGAAGTGAEPFNYKYVMYYDGTDGSHEDTGLAYSADGLTWSAYTANPVLSGTGTGGVHAWDCGSAVYGTVLKDANGYHYYYSGRGQDDGSGGCAFPASFDGIGYASSSDGKTWTRDADNPIFDIGDGVAYRAGRVYTPDVIYDGSGNLRMYFSVQDANDGVKKIAYAALPDPAVTPTPSASAAASASPTASPKPSILPDTGITTYFLIALLLIALCALLFLRFRQLKHNVKTLEKREGETVAAEPLVTPESAAPAPSAPEAVPADQSTPAPVSAPPKRKPRVAAKPKATTRPKPESSKPENG